MTGVHRDVTEEKIREIELEKSKEEAEKREFELIESQKIAKIGSWNYDVSTDKVFWTEELYAMYGLDIHEPLPNYAETEHLYSAESWKALAQSVEKATTTRIPYELELELRRPDGSVAWIWAKGEPILDDKNQVRGLRGVTQDITEKKEKEKELVLQNDALKKANTELDNFVYSVSHDLRAPITSSLGLTELCLMLEPELELKELLNKQFASLNKLDQFIKDILNYSRNSRLEVQKKPVAFKGFIEEIISQHNALKSTVNVRISVEEQAPLVTDETRLTMIFNNLISNAFKFSASYKENSFIEIKAEIMSEKVILKVSDNGIGIKQEYLSSIFDMFFRATDSNYGSGLGLYITKEAIQKMGGEIMVQSTYGEGTSFSIILPNYSS